MRRLIAIAAVSFFATATFADSNLVLKPISGVRNATYHMATGRFTPTPYSERHSASIWDMPFPDRGWYVPSMNWRRGVSALVGDWGDIADGALVDGFAFAYATDLSMPTTIDCLITFYSEYSGFNNNGYYPTHVFYFDELPTAVGSYNGWNITVDLDGDPNDPNSTRSSFRVTGNDLDGDDMADFGYSYWFPNLSGLGSATGPLVPTYSRYPDLDSWHAAEASLGIENVFDAHIPDQTDPNAFVYDGSHGFDCGTPYDPNCVYGQLYMDLFGAIPCGWAGVFGSYCTADLDGDCMIGLSDLAALLANYGSTGGAVGDYDDDGNVDLSDLAFLLSQYGDNCRSGCGDPGASGYYCTADIDGSGDCMVGLPDLAALLSSYGANDGGDIDGDSDTDLQDLALLLAQYGDNCGY